MKSQVSCSFMIATLPPKSIFFCKLGLIYSFCLTGSATPNINRQLSSTLIQETSDALHAVNVSPILEGVDVSSIVYTNDSEEATLTADEFEIDNPYHLVEDGTEPTDRVVVGATITWNHVLGFIAYITRWIFP